MIIVRDADDVIVGFEHEADARRFLQAMRERLEKFALSLHPDKTRLIEFGRFAAANRKRRGLGRASTTSAGDLQLLGFHLHLRHDAARQVPHQAEDSRRPHAGEVASHQTGTATAHAPADSRPGEMAGTGCARLIQLLRGADQRAGALRLPFPHPRPLATIAQATQPERRHDLAADRELGRRLAPRAARPPSLAVRPLRRHTPEVGAVCGKVACAVLCGGRAVMRIPTATDRAWTGDREEFGLP
jgi:hypothetical protein